MISGHSVGHNSISYIILQVQSVIFMMLMYACFHLKNQLSIRSRDLETQVMRFDLMTNG